MPKYILIIVLILIAVLFIYQFFFRKATFTDQAKINLNNTEYTLEIARTMSQKAQGLSGRNSLCPTCGMIFLFSKDGTQPFWMKDTLIPLDMIWINSSGQIVYIQTAQPEPDVPLTQLKIYQNTVPAKYVIELNAGDTAKLNLKIGDIINLSSIK